MEKFKSLFFSTFLLMMLFMSEQYCFSKDTTTIIIRKDDTSEPTPSQPNGFVSLLSVSATIDDTWLTVFFESSIGDATITVTNDSTGIVYQEVVDTCLNDEFIILVDMFSSGNYTLTISYKKTTLIGQFLME